MVEIACVLLGFAISIVTTIGFECYQERKRKKYYANVLYHDLLSIMQYFKGEYKWDETDMYPEIRYNADWQSAVANLTYLRDNQIKLVHNIYDAVFDYDYLLSRTKGKKKRKEYRCKIEKIVNGYEFGEFMLFLKRKLKIKEQA